MAVKRLFNIREQFFDTQGNVLNGGKLFFYAAGSSTKQTTFNSSLGTVANSNPMILDAFGRLQAEVWLTTGLLYKEILTTSTDTDPPVSPIWSEDNISGINDATITINEWVAGPTPTFASATSFTLVGDQTTLFSVGRRLKLTVSAGTVYATIVNSSFAGLTTVTVAVDSGAVDSGLSAVSYGLLAADNPSLPLPKLTAIAGNLSLTPRNFVNSTLNITASAALTLPVASTLEAGQPCTIKSTTTGNVTIVPAGADTIDGTNATLRVPSFDTWIIVSNGSNGYLILTRGQWNVGDTKYSASANAPIGFIAASNTLYSRTTYAGLFAEIGTTWGAGDASTTFGVCDMRGRSPVGVGTGTVVEACTASSANGFTVAANNTKWNTGQAVILSNLTGFTTTATAGPTYFVSRISSTNIRLATTLALAQNATPDITISGSGTVTVTGTLTIRTLGENGGEESHAMSITELLAHTHQMTSSNTGVGAGSEIGSVGVAGTNQGKVTLSTGGNAAMNIMSPFAALNAYIKT